MKIENQSNLDTILKTNPSVENNILDFQQKVTPIYKVKLNKDKYLDTVIISDEVRELIKTHTQ